MRRPRPFRLKKLLGPVLATAFWPQQSLWAGLPDTVAKVKSGVVGVGTVLPARRPPARLLGTGFAVANGRHVVTNAHVIPEDIAGDQNEFLAIFVGRGDQAEVRAAAIVLADREHDLALLEIEGDALWSLSLGNARRVREGALYAFTGYPVGAFFGLYPVTHRGIVSAISPIVVPTQTETNTPYPVFQLDATAYPGNSGSPLYEPASGRVVGVINKVFVKAAEKPSGITYAVPVNHVRDLLVRAGV